MAARRRQKKKRNKSIGAGSAAVVTAAATSATANVERGGKEIGLKDAQTSRSPAAPKCDICNENESKYRFKCCTWRFCGIQCYKHHTEEKGEKISCIDGLPLAGENILCGGPPTETSDKRKLFRDNRIVRPPSSVGLQSEKQNWFGVCKNEEERVRGAVTQNGKRRANCDVEGFGGDDGDDGDQQNSVAVGETEDGELIEDSEIELKRKSAARQHKDSNENGLSRVATIRERIEDEKKLSFSTTETTNRGECSIVRCASTVRRKFVSTMGAEGDAIDMDCFSDGVESDGRSVGEVDETEDELALSASQINALRDNPRLQEFFNSRWLRQVVMQINEDRMALATLGMYLRDEEFVKFTDEVMRTVGELAENYNPAN